MKKCIQKILEGQNSLKTVKFYLDLLYPQNDPMLYIMVIIQVNVLYITVKKIANLKVLLILVWFINMKLGFLRLANSNN